jgi:CRISPR-associated protein Cmr2
MTSPIYTAITFAPVQGFIEKSRKLRDLYGSSFILSYLSQEVCESARRYFVPEYSTKNEICPGDPVVSPALINVTQGVPNQILIRGELPRGRAFQAFTSAWKRIVLTCKTWIEDRIKCRQDGTPWDYTYWHRFWDAWINHAWEFFWATGTGETGDSAKEALNECKFARAWTGVNWAGESSTLSGIDGRAWPHMGQFHPSRSQALEDQEVREFCGQLMEHLSEAAITNREFLSIPELVKRLVTYDEVVAAVVDQQPKRMKVEIPSSFKDLNRLLDRKTENTDDRKDALVDEADREEAKRWTGWFQGDGDRAGDFLLGQPDQTLHRFSQNMRLWGANLHSYLPRAYRDNKLDPDGRIIYAGGDDFLGVFYRNPPKPGQSFTVAESPPMSPLECLQWFETFKSRVWQNAALWQDFRTEEPDQPDGTIPITVSVGFVWTAPNVPQRDVLQHCREAEQSAKGNGRDRIACRILFNDGKHLEWTCPWWLLEGNIRDPLGPDALPGAGILATYRDRRGVQGHDAAPNWTHIYNDVATLEARHGFAEGADVALGLIRIYFGEDYYDLLSDRSHWWNQYEDPEAKKVPTFTGILGDEDRISSNPESAFNTWVINLAKVGFHITQPIKSVPNLSLVEAA